MLLAILVALPLAAPPQTDYDELLALGRKLAEEQDWPGAEDALLSAARVKPRSTEPLLTLAQIYMAQGEPRRALGPIDEALARSRGDFHALFLRGTVLIRLGMFQEAVLELSTALESDPDDEACRKMLALAGLRARDPAAAASALAPVVRAGATTDAAAYGMYGAALVELGREEEALAPLGRALSLEPGQPQAVFYSGRALLAAGRYEEAAARFGEGVSLPPPQQVRYVLGLAEARMEQARADDARAILDDLVARHPKVARAYFLLGLIEAEAESYSEAVPLFEAAIENGYQAADAYLNLGMARAAVDDDSGAREALGEAIRRDADVAAAYYYLGVLRLEAASPYEAIDLLERAATLEPDEPRTFLALAEAHLKLDQLIQALAAAEKAAAPSRLGGRGHYTKALVHHERREYPEAETEYREALSLGLDLPHVHLNLGRVLYAMARHEDADVSVTLVLEQEPDNGEAQLLKGKIDLELRRYDSALEHLNRAVELLPEEAEVWYRRGAVHSRRRASSEAIADWRKTLALDPDWLDAYYRLGTELLRAGEGDEGERVLAEFQRRNNAEEKESHRDAKLRTTVRRALELTDQRRDDEALRYFDEALAIDAEAPLVYLALADFYTLRGKPENAERILLRGLAKIPGHISLHQTLLSLYEAIGDEDKARDERLRLAELKGTP